jgi:hypothetical protein
MLAFNTGMTLVACNRDPSTEAATSAALTGALSAGLCLVLSRFDHPVIETRWVGCVDTDVRGTVMLVM